MIRPLLCLPPLLLAGCAATGDYPSLARRPAERITGTAEVVTPTPDPAPTPAPPSPDMTTRLAQLVEQARGAHQRFAERRGNAERLVGGAGGAAVASEGWSVASIALAELEAARSQTMIALAALDQLYTAAAVAAAETGNPGNADAARAAQQQVGAWVAEEDEVLGRLRGKL